MKRQACRLAHALAEKLQVAIPTIDEDGTFVQTVDQAPRATARPAHVQWISSIAHSRSGPPRNSVDTVSQYMQCSPAPVGEDAALLHFVSVSPSVGFAAVRIEQKGFLPPSGALPTTTGRAKTPDQTAKMPVDRDTMTRIASRYAWEGKAPTLTAATINDRLHPEAYRPFDNAFLARNFEQQGWRNMGNRPMEDWYTVVLKSSARKVRPVAMGADADAGAAGVQ